MPLKNPSLAALQQSRSRFCEGSMNDRASAVPPVHFLGPDALAALEQPACNPPRPSHETGSSSSNNSNSNSNNNNSSGGGAWSRKTGSRLFGQVWEGVRGKLRLRPRDTAVVVDGPDAKKMTMPGAPAAVISAATTTTAVTATNAQQQQQQHNISIYTDPAEHDNEYDGPPASRTRSRLTAAAAAAAPIDVPGATAAGFQFTGFQSARPSREEVLASYQQLMAGGFFQANAIPSSRHGRPGSSLPVRPATSHHQPPSSSPPPQWPLAATPHHHHHHHHHHQGFSPCPVQSPTSVSSRGTKRAAAPDSDSDESMHDDGDFSSSYKENQAPPHPNTVHDDKQPKKRLRRLPSCESLFLPKIRGSSSSSSASTTTSSAASSFRRRFTPSYSVPLQKRRPQPQLQPQWQGSSSSSSSSGVAAARPRHVSDGGGSARVLRGWAAEAHRPMRVVPDEGRGIPSVPVIPARFTFGEDRQNNGPWRGLRVR
ncbi:hypothetical protein MY10362_002674 [Beauveria mimosiformis]